MSLLYLQGGATFLIVKGIFKVYYKQQQHVMQKQRIIKDHPVHEQYETSLAAAVAAAAASAAASATTNPSAVPATTPAPATATAGDRLLEAVTVGLNNYQSSQVPGTRVLEPAVNQYSETNSNDTTNTSRTINS